MMNNLWHGETGNPAMILVLVLGHTLWQAFAVTVLLWLALWRLPAGRVRTRYGMCAAALAAVVCGAAVTASILTIDPAPGNSRRRDVARITRQATSMQTSDSKGEAIMSGGRAPDEAGMVPVSRPGRAVVLPYPDAVAYSRLLALAWGAGALLMLTRLVGSVRGAGRLGRSGEEVTNSQIKRMLQDISDRLHISGIVHLRVSFEVTGPMVLGFLRPVILIPPSLLTGLPPEILRAALAHELAHISRHDYVVNIGQMLVEALLFFNPCVWWISGQMRVEREACCDMEAANLTGGAEVYAAALADAAVFGANRVSGAAVAALSMGAPSSGVLLDRVRRLLFPAHTARPRLSWHTLLASLAAWVAVLAGLWMGAMAGVAAAQHALSSEQRISQVQKAEDEFGVPPVQSMENDQETTVSGVIRLEDGREITKNSIIVTHSHRPRKSSGQLLNARNGSFEGQIQCGLVSLAASYPGYAPEMAGPLNLEPDMPLTGLELVLKRGYRSEILFTNEEDEPLSGGKAQIGYRLPGDENPLTTVYVKANDRGMAVIDHAATYPVTLAATAPGYEPAKREEKRLPEGAPLRWKLRAARPTEGTVVDEATGLPIAGAVLKLAASRGAEGNRRTVMTTATVTNAEGKFALTELRDDTRYDFLVDAPPRRPTWLADVRAGQTGLQARMGAPLTVSGTLRGNFKFCTKWDDVQRAYIPAITVIDWLKYPFGNYTEQRSRLVPLEIRDGVGYFSAEGIVPGKIQLRWNNDFQKLEVNSQDSVEGLELSTEIEEPTGMTTSTRTELATAQRGQDAPRKDEISTRTVALNFKAPANSPPPSGTMYLNYRGLAGDRNSATYSPLPITGEEMRFVVKVPSGISYKPASTLGYWFKAGNTQISAGADEFVIEIPLYAAGSISGVVFDPQGRAAPNAHVSVSVVEAPAGLVKDKFDLTPDIITVNNEGRFNITPLPLGGSYSVSVNDGNSYVISDAVPLTTAEPTRTMTMQLVKGVALEGRARDEAGEPALDVPMRLTLESPGMTRVLADQSTDRDGRFRVNGLNPDAGGDYRLEAKSRRNFQPVKMLVKPGGGPVDIVLKRGLGIQGRVVDEAGKPVERATVFAIPKSGVPSGGAEWVQILSEEPTDETGKFRFSNLREGEFVFRVRMVGALKDGVGRAGSDKPVEVKIRAVPGMQMDE